MVMVPSSAPESELALVPRGDGLENIEVGDGDGWWVGADDMLSITLGHSMIR